jgi:predicted DNA-binding transcriptional regulator AlpA
MASILPPAPGPGAPEPISVRIPDAVRLTGMSRSRIYELIRAGDLEIVKVGASTLVLTESIKNFIESLRAR